jgi:hypothetical protein
VSTRASSISNLDSNACSSVTEDANSKMYSSFMSTPPTEKRSVNMNNKLFKLIVYLSYNDARSMATTLDIVGHFVKGDTTQISVPTEIYSERDR